MLKTLVLVSVCTVLAGCAAQVVSSSDRTVVVRTQPSDYSGAQTLANVECQKVGLSAKLAGKPSPSHFVYDCVR